MHHRIYQAIEDQIIIFLPYLNLCLLTKDSYAHFCLSTLALLREMKHHELAFRDHKLSEGHFLPNVGQVLKIRILTTNSAFRTERNPSCKDKLG